MQICQICRVLENKSANNELLKMKCNICKHTVDETKWVAKPHASISAPSNLVPVRPTYSPADKYFTGD